MKAEDLMIGDWVRVADDDTDAFFDARVGTLTRVENIYLVPPGEEMAQPFSIDCVEPIPLTPEILEKNGFVEEEYPIIYDRREFESRHGDYRIIVSPLNDGYTRIYKGGYLPILNNCYINFVHELQHALRLCGIDKTIEL